MTKKEISRKLDEIIEFSGCERYVDTPAKRYSSGMKVRLAFAVAAFLEPDILVVDEVLAVGDAEFQKKAIGKMQNISSQAGRTVLFVSHDMGAIQSLCSRLMVLQNGQIFFKGGVSEGIDSYLISRKKRLQISKYEDSKLKLRYLNFYKNDKVINVFKVFESVKIKGGFKYLNDLPNDIKIELFVVDNYGQRISAISSWLSCISFSPKSKKIYFEVTLTNGFSIKSGNYYLDILIYDFKKSYFENVLTFELLNDYKYGYIEDIEPRHHGRVYTPNVWKIN